MRGVQAARQHDVQLQGLWPVHGVAPCTTCLRLHTPVVVTILSFAAQAAAVASAWCWLSCASVEPWLRFTFLRRSSSCKCLHPYTGHPRPHSCLHRGQ